MTEDQMDQLAEKVVSKIFSELKTQADQNNDLLKDIVHKDDIIKEITRLQKLILECEKTEEYEAAIDYIDRVQQLEEILKSKL